ncbi:hypothetical protein OK016_08675 [Vibrio chagasii]|nr:hypothetical protein [Vibrio chagasii]
MGCVTWLERHFKDRQLTATNFDNAIEAAKSTLAPILEATPISVGMCVLVPVVPFKALQEIMLAQGMDEVITHTKPNAYKKQAMITERLKS